MAEKKNKHVEDILKALGKDADRKEIEKDLKHYMDEFRFEADEAARLVIRKHGGSSFSPEGDKKQIKELTPLDKNVNLLCRVVFVTEKTIKRDGQDTAIISGILGDESGTVPFTIWEKADLKLEKGDVVRMEHAYITEYREEPQVNVGYRGRVVKADKSEMPEFKGTGAPRTAKACKIIDLGDATGNLSVVARILTVDIREVTVSGEKKEVMSGIMADETGKVSFTCWGKAKFKEGDIIKVNSGYLRKWRGMPQLNFDATNTEKSKEKMPASEELEKPSVVSVDYLSRVGGMVDASLNGVILDVREGSGLVFRCPECNRALQKNVCRVHGQQEGIADLRIKAIVDDGTGALNVIMNRDITERLLGKSLDKCLKEATKAMDHGIIKDQLFEKLVAKPISVTGNVTSDEFGLMMIASGTDYPKVDTQAEARRILEEIS